MIRPLLFDHRKDFSIIKIVAFQHQSIIENMDRVNVFRNICEYRSDSNRGLLDVIEDGYVCGNER
jgi:hypothetical protein